MNFQGDQQQFQYKHLSLKKISVKYPDLRSITELSSKTDNTVTRIKTVSYLSQLKTSHIRIVFYQLMTYH